MNDLSVLRDAFAELERRAESPGHADRLSTPARRPRRRSAVLIGASVAVVAVVALTIALALGQAGGPGPTAPAAGHRTVLSTPAPAATTRAPHPTPSAPVVVPVPIQRPVHSGPPAVTRRTLPRTGKELAKQLRAALAGRATFTYSAPSAHEAWISGRMTSAAGRGGFDIQVESGGDPSTNDCEDPGLMKCHKKRLAGGTSVAVGVEDDGPGGILYAVYVVHPDGATIVFHLANRQDPKRDGNVLSVKPPLSRKQMVTVATSAQW